jgi:Tripartite tricarboxylate transporter family receptor
MASGGKGIPGHVAGELFKMMAGVDMIHVPYRGEGLALPDLISGQVQVLFGAMPASLGYIRAGKLRALAVTTATRQEVLPDVPTVILASCLRRKSLQASTHVECELNHNGGHLFTNELMAGYYAQLSNHPC